MIIIISLWLSLSVFDYHYQSMIIIISLWLSLSVYDYHYQSMIIIFKLRKAYYDVPDMYCLTS